MQKWHDIDISNHTEKTYAYMCVCVWRESDPNTASVCPRGIKHAQEKGKKKKKREKI